MRLAFLGSGSRGNGTLLEAQGCRLLIDCGFSLREARRRAASLEFDLASLDAILVTHEHSDHGSGVAALSRHYDIPVYMTHGTQASGRLDGCARTVCFDADAQFTIGSFRIHAVAVPHDAREPVQYCLEVGEQRVGVLTDLGSVTPHVQRAFGGCELLVLEFNHDPLLLEQGPYPPSLKRRVAGAWGHLSNAQAMELLAALDGDCLQHLVIAHMSEKNNSPQIVEDLLHRHSAQLLAKTHWADQQTGLDWIAVEPGECKAAAPAAVLV